MTSRQIARHVALSTLSSVYRLTQPMSLNLEHRRVQFLCFHDLKDKHKNAFRRLVARLATKHRFLSYSEATGKILSGSIDAPYIVFSIDDGFRSGLGMAEILEELGARACFFICPSIIGETDPKKIEVFCKTRLHVTARPFLSWDEIARLLARGHEVGSHTMTHADLGKLPPAQIEEEVYVSYEVLSRRVGKVTHFAWPYGRLRHFSAAASRAVFKAGYISCASTERGCHVNGNRGFEKGLCLWRDNMAPNWPVGHCLYFLARNSSRAGAAYLPWPAEWDPDPARTQPLTPM